MIIDYENTEMKVDGNIVINSKRELSDIVYESYDFVIASAVLEHIPDFYKTITTLFSMVKENGYFYARTPYVEPFMRLSNKIDMTYPGHLYDLGGNYWNNIIKTYNLNAVILNSRPSIVESGFNQSFFRTLMAYILKVPGYLESKFFPTKNKIYWKWVGGWEIYLKFPKDNITTNIVELDK
ncbi:methyltransferase domain-containing protein [Aliarcobacter skirrowii]|nr:methyltransferase domain-containing protein [Aliarcobacter skirrowii]MDX4050851.1 methyltransferase domain-containing protein [Aliarcobacter skirrowii]